MRPVLAQIGHVNLGHGLILTLVVFLLMLLWRRAARALGEDVPPLTAVAVLLTFLVSVTIVVIVAGLINRFGPVQIRAYGAMLVLGFAAATAWCIHEGERLGYAPAVFLDLALFVLIGSVVGARLVYVLLCWQAYSGQVSQMLALWRGGLSFHGGVLGGILAGWVYCWRTKHSFLKLADIVAPGIALGYVFGRIGCFLNGCCYGVPTRLLCGVRFPDAAWLDGRPITEPVHPTQLYAAAASLFIFFLLVLTRRRLRRPGHLLLLYLLLYSVYRFAIEYLRRGVTAAPFTYLPQLTVAQVASIVVGGACLLAMAVTWPRGEKNAGGG